jgi:NAD(P)-dependent dehydrogenase (short-subunit alcohol dehydrogenase family)
MLTTRIDRTFLRQALDLAINVSVDANSLSPMHASSSSFPAWKGVEGLLLHAWLLMLQVMREQETGGKIFFIDGAGAWGNPTPQKVAYGAAKRAITQVKVNAQPKYECTQYQRTQ